MRERDASSFKLLELLPLALFSYKKGTRYKVEGGTNGCGRVEQQTHDDNNNV